VVNGAAGGLPLSQAILRCARPGLVRQATIAQGADWVTGQGGKANCLGWCDRVLGRAGLRAAAAAAAAVILAGCGLLGGPAALQREDSQSITVTSSEFGQGRAIPRQYTCRDRRETPPISWSGAPPGTRTLALVMDDSDTPITPYIYWIVFNISPATPDIQANRLPPGALQAINSRGTVGYAAPCPGHTHEYRFTVYALNTSLKLPEGASLSATLSEIADHALTRGRLMGVVRP
jgi:Raf kinase inhibitor-like YbhB/YbcL family protein